MNSAVLFEHYFFFKDSNSFFWDSIAFSAALSSFASFSFFDFNLLAWVSSFLSLVVRSFSCFWTRFWYCLYFLSACCSFFVDNLMAFLVSTIPFWEVLTSLAVASAVFDAPDRIFSFSANTALRLAVVQIRKRKIKFVSVKSKSASPQHIKHGVSTSEGSIVSNQARIRIPI